MKTIKNIVKGDRRPDLVAPQILDPENFKFHWKAAKLGRDGEPVVMFSTGPVFHQGGTGDAIRDGDNRPWLEWSRNTVAYCRHSDWVAAGYSPLI